MEESNVSKLGPVTVEVSADLNLTGSGRGYHGKLMLGDMNGSNVSFGIQYDAKSGLDDGQWLEKESIYQKMLQAEEYMKAEMLYTLPMDQLLLGKSSPQFGLLSKPSACSLLC